jgi:ATP-binding cassette subfamily B protein
MANSYTLNKFDKASASQQKTSVISSIKKMIPLTKGEGWRIIFAFCMILITAGSSVLIPIIVASIINNYILTHQFDGVLYSSATMLVIYIFALGAQYIQITTMGIVGRRVLFNLRNILFNKIQELPVAFFNQNKAGDLISRINNDTDQLNQFFSQALIQFMGNFFLMLGTGVFLVVLHPNLGLLALAPAFLVIIITQVISPWVKKRNLRSLQGVGGLSAEISESLENFKVIVAFNRLDYFRQKFGKANDINYNAATKAGVANNVFTPLYGLASNLAQLAVLVYGIYLITHGNLTLGLLVGYFLYVNNFYTPLRQIASIWPSFQTAMAGLDRISEIMTLKNDMEIIAAPGEVEPTSSLIEFRKVSFSYPDGKEVLHNVSMKLEKGKTYALVGPTGGGKTTTASLMARLYDPTKGEIVFYGRNIMSYSAQERAEMIGFITQEPFLFTGTVKDNIVYANPQYVNYSSEDLRVVLEESNLSNLLARFDEGLETKIATSGASISLGQKQLIAFMRAVLRHPKLLILDEATANIDTVTEQLLDDILNHLPAETTKVIIAHRLNTINNADEIFFVNGGEVTEAGSMEHALDMLLHGKRES